MPYTRVWNNNAVVGSTQAATIDTGFQNFRGDLEERLEDKFITDVVVDPWVVKPEILGNVTGKKLYFHHSAFVCHSDLAESRSDLFVAHPSNNATADFWAPLFVPIGCTIQSVLALVDRQTQTVTLELAYNESAGGAKTSVASVSDSSTAGIFNLSISPGHLVSINRYYYIRVRLPGFVTSARLYGAVVTYDTPDCRNVL